MKAMALPSGDQRGRAICRPWRGPETSGGGEDRGGFRVSGSGLRVELGDPPVVFTGRVGGDVGEGRGIGRPVEFIDVKVGGREEDRRGGLGRGDRN